MIRRALPCLLCLVLGACRDPAPGSSDAGTVDGAGPPACEVVFAGDYAEHVVVEGGCAVLSRHETDAGPTWVLHLRASSAVANAESRFDANLGPTPAPGTYNDGTVPAWSALAILPAGCTFSAGAMAVPQGSFQLSLTRVELAEAGAVVQGTLHVQETVHAAPGTVCGNSSQETVDFRF